MGCSSVGYLFQAGKGQLSLFTHARPIPEVIKDEKTPPRIKTLLSEISTIKKYGEKQGLKPTSNYTDYVKLDRRAAVWVVSACEPLEFKSKEWKFPIVGSFPYLGWFDLEQAKSYAQDLSKEGLDVDLRGASAYSTLGWFKDPVLSTMIPDGQEALGDLVNVVLHESVHATLYINGQAYFNESVASFVADHLTLDYLRQSRGKDSIEETAFVQAEQNSKKIQQKLHEAYQQLNGIYHSNSSDLKKLEAKTKILTELKSELKFKREINNATLIQYKTYNTGYEIFDQLIEACQGNWTKFMTVLARLKSDSFSKPQANEIDSAIRPLILSKCQ